jgi:uncharacterized protein YegP (UPF0339 family)
MGKPAKSVELRLSIYQDKAGGWRWRLKASNGRIVADSGEAYVSHANALRAAKRLREASIWIAD